MKSLHQLSEIVHPINQIDMSNTFGGRRYVTRSVTSAAKKMYELQKQGKSYSYSYSLYKNEYCIEY